MWQLPRLGAEAIQKDFFALLMSGVQTHNEWLKCIYSQGQAWDEGRHARAKKTNIEATVLPPTFNV